MRAASTPRLMPPLPRPAFKRLCRRRGEGGVKAAVPLRSRRRSRSGVRSQARSGSPPIVNVAAPAPSAAGFGRAEVVALVVDAGAGAARTGAASARVGAASDRVAGVGVGVGVGRAAAARSRAVVVVVLAAGPGAVVVVLVAALVVLVAR